MPLYKFIQLMLVAPVDFFSRRYYMGVASLLGCVCFAVFHDMDYWSSR